MNNDISNRSPEDVAVLTEIAEEPGFLQPLIIAVLVTALVSGPIVIIRLVSQDAAWRWLTITVFMIALQAILTSRWLAHAERRYYNHTRYRLAELIVIALALRLFTWLLDGGFPDLQQWRAYLLAPLSFLDGLYLGYLICALFAWERATTLYKQRRALAINRAEAQFYALPLDSQGRRPYDRPVDRERPYIFNGLVASWIGGGMILALCATLSTFELDTVSFADGFRNITRLGLNTHMLIALLVYFILGLWVVSQARLDMMRARWLAGGIAADESVIANWRRSSVLLILLVATVAAFLPIGSTFAAAVVLQVIFGAVLFISQLVFYAINALFLLLISLFARNTPGEEIQEPLPPPPSAPPPDPAGVPLSETGALIAGGLFWTLVALVAVAALFFFLRDRGIQLELAPLRGLFRRLRDGLAHLLQQILRRTSRVSGRLRRQISSGATGSPLPTPSWRFFRVNALPPRERVRYFYLSTLRRAADEGLPRDQSETPLEYAADLQERWPEASHEIDLLTGAFNEARYSAHAFDEEDVHPIKRIWKKVRGAIRRRKPPSL